MENNEKLFTQEEVNNIISKRLTQEREKYEKEYRAKSLKTEARAELMKNGLSPDLADALNLSDAETAKNSVNAIIKATAAQTRGAVGYKPAGGMEPPRDNVRKAMGLP